jgi:alpha-glucosidase
MPWDASPNAGFTEGAPWLPLGSDWRTVNVAAQESDPRSMLSLYRALISLRRAEPALSVGAYAPVRAEEDVLAYERRANRRFLVALNLGGRPQELRGVPTGTVRLSTHLDRAGEPVEATLRLRPDEGIVVALADAGTEDYSMEHQT